MKKDPIPIYERYLLENGAMTQDEMDAVKAGILEEIDKAVKFAEESPDPTAEEVLEDVFT